jgi:hypothetical protein
MNVCCSLSVGRDIRFGSSLRKSLAYMRDRIRVSIARIKAKFLGGAIITTIVTSVLAMLPMTIQTQAAHASGGGSIVVSGHAHARAHQGGSHTKAKS